MLEEGSITQEQLAQAIATQKENAKMLGEVLIDYGFITPKQLISILSKQVYSYNYLIDKVISENTPKNEVAKIDLQYFEKMQMFLPVKFTCVYFLSVIHNMCNISFTIAFVMNSRLF